MACYASSNYTIAIDSSGNVKVKDRSNARVMATFSLGTAPVKLSKSSSSFCIIGTTNPEDTYFTTSPLSGNTVNVTTSTVLDINGSESIDLASYDAVIKLNGSTLEFYRHSI